MKKLLVITAVTLALTACATPPTEVGGALFNITQQPLLVSAQPGKKVGRACAQNILGLFITGDMSVEAAKKNGGITKVATVDKDIKGYAVWAEVCTVVTGE
jgi:hypothetical protein